jgi:hypothetical protein
MSFKVFISYSHRDGTRARQVKRLLDQSGTEVFLAEITLDPGEELAARIVEAIKRSDLFVLLWSHHAKRSEWVPQEIGIARAAEIPMVPIILHKSAEPAPGFLRGLKYLPLYKDPTKSLAWLQKNVFERAQGKKQKDGLAWLGLGAVIVYLLTGKKE